MFRRHTPQHPEPWGTITRRWRLGRRLGMAHLLGSPVLIYLLSFPVKWFAPSNWLISGQPVWYFLVAALIWLLVFIYLLLRDRYYRCPACGTRVRPFGGTDVPNWNPHPCPQCGLAAPPPPY